MKNMEGLPLSGCGNFAFPVPTFTGRRPGLPAADKRWRPLARVVAYASCGACPSRWPYAVVSDAPLLGSQIAGENKGVSASRAREAATAPQPSCAFSRGPNNYEPRNPPCLAPLAMARSNVSDVYFFPPVRIVWRPRRLPARIALPPTHPNAPGGASST